MAANALRVLGVDPGTQFTGYGIVEKGPGGSLVHICDGRIRLSPAAPLPERLSEISKRLSALIAEFGPSVMAVESLFFAKNVKSVITLSHARGVILLEAANKGMGVCEYAPSSIKQAVTGYGAATKDQMQKMVKMLLGQRSVSETDAADALAIAICHINHSMPACAAHRGASSAR